MRPRGTPASSGWVDRIKPRAFASPAGLPPLARIQSPRAGRSRDEDAPSRVASRPCVPASEDAAHALAIPEFDVRMSATLHSLGDTATDAQSRRRPRSRSIAHEAGSPINRTLRALSVRRPARRPGDTAARGAIRAEYQPSSTERSDVGLVFRNRLRAATPGRASPIELAR